MMPKALVLFYKAILLTRIADRRNDFHKSS